MDADLQALARCVGDTEAFASRHWGHAPLLHRGAGPFDDLLDLDAVDVLLTSTARRPTFRLVLDGGTIPPAAYTTSVRLGGAAVDDAADVARIGEHVAAGATLVLQGLHRTWPPLTRFCRALERATSHPVQANAYLTPAGAAGLARHADTHDVLVLQLFGSKGWDVEGLDPFDLDAGDVLYLPAGTRHAATAQSSPSLHLTIGLLRVTWRQVLRRALDAGGADLDDPLPLGFARPGAAEPLAAEVAARVAVAAERLASADAVALAAGEVERAQRRRAPLLTGQLRSVLALADLDDRTCLRRRPDNPARLTTGDDGRLVLALADRTLRLPPIARPSLELLLERSELAVGELPGLDAGGRAVLARRLVREGLIEVVDGS